jgi:GTP cyclohydrolase I
MSTPDIDTAAENIAAAFDALGIDWRGLDDMHDTPARIARMWDEMTTPECFEFTVFANDGYDEMVVERDIGLVSVCRHHFLPFIGSASVGYIPAEKVAGLSKLARAVDFFARRPQVQEALASDIADLLVRELDPIGVGVIIRARHTCMTCRGAMKPGAETITCALRGAMKHEPQTREEFLTLSQAGG